MKSFFKNTYLAFIFLMLYLPITVLMLFSFNSGDSVRTWDSWSWQAYADLFDQSDLWQSVSVTLIVAFISTFVAVILGTFAALGLSKTKKLTRNLTLGITNIPLVNADIVTAVSLMLLFMALGFNFGMVTLILAHISFNIPYVIITVLPKIRAINISQLEASQDLGATPWYTLRKIVLPTIKPAIITGAAIAFAMSFDDFLISYFTGGNAANVSTFIYSLKRVKPYINAFSTIIIILIAFIIISWNGYIISKKQLRIRNENIAKGTYHDKKINKIEKMLNKYYLQLNNFTRKTTRSKKQQLPYHDLNFEIIKKEDLKIAQQRINKNPKLVQQIFKLEDKIDRELVWEQQTKAKLKAKKEKKEERSKIRREKYRFLRWPWKMIMTSTLVLAGFTSLGAIYLATNTYDLAVFNWGEYMSPSVLQGFENRYHVKVKYTTYADNESLYAKLYTTNYDVMVPSDYMVAKLAQDDRIIKLDQTKLNFNPQTTINANLYQQLESYQFIDSSKTLHQGKGLNDYCIPYFWGDVVLVVNTINSPHILQELGIEANPDYAQWSVLQTAAQQGKTIILNDDMHNLFMTSLVDQHFKNKWNENNGSDNFNQKGNTFGNTSQYLNAHFHSNDDIKHMQEIDDAKTWLTPIISNKNTKLLNDNIIDEISNLHGWDIAMMYNGDLLEAIGKDPSKYDGKYKVIRPYMGTNVWSDNIVISKNSPHQTLAYQFINYIMELKTQVSLSSEFGYTAPSQAAMDIVSKLDPAAIWTQIYQPLAGQVSAPIRIDPGKHSSGYFNGSYYRDADTFMQTAYNELLAR